MNTVVISNTDDEEQDSIDRLAQLGREQDELEENVINCVLDND